MSPAGLLLFLIKIYQHVVAPWLPQVCRFTPSCSHYGAEAISRYGAVRGGILTVWRVLRCQPFCKGGYDPVPELPHRNHDRNQRNQKVEGKK